MSDLSQRVGVVVIGRNEGARLGACLASLTPLGLPIVYVDSDSSDGSPRLAEQAGATVLPLDTNRPLNASRARREGAELLFGSNSEMEYVAFFDGDCTVDPDWIATAAAALDDDQELGAVCGRRRELAPKASAYNLICDHEWDTPIGPCQSVGGDSVFRAVAYRETGGFDPTVPAGEEPELCQRLRDAGWKLERLDAEMTTHDAALTSFGPWWRRQVRTGYSGADVEARFGLGLFDGLIRGALFWTDVFPLIAALATGVAFFLGGRGAGLAVLLASIVLVVLQVVRIASRIKGRTLGERLKIAALTMAAKPAIAIGAKRYGLEKVLGGRQAKLIEYKQPATSAPGSAGG